MLFWIVTIAAVLSVAATAVLVVWYGPGADTARLMGEYTGRSLVVALVLFLVSLAWRPIRRYALPLGFLVVFLPTAAIVALAAPRSLEQAVALEADAVRGDLPAELPNGMVWYRVEADGPTFVVYHAFPEWVSKDTFDEETLAQLREGYVGVACEPRFRSKLEQGWRNRWVLTTSDRETVLTVDASLEDCN